MTQLPAGPLVADASFLISVAEADAPAMRFVSVLQRCRISTVTFGEVCYKLEQKSGVAAADTLTTFAGLAVALDPVTTAHALLFSQLKSIDAACRAAHTGPKQAKSLSLGAMVCLAHAMSAGNLPVLTGDKHWLTLPTYGLPLAVFDYRDPALEP